MPIGRRLLRDNSFREPRGYLIVRADSGQVATYVRAQPGLEPLGAGEFAVNFRKERGGVGVGAADYAIEEGTRQRYDAAAYGGLRVDREGHTLLEGLYDARGKRIE